jgi:hypothetical protein
VTKKAAPKKVRAVVLYVCEVRSCASPPAAKS